MKYKFWILVLVLFIKFDGFSQEKYIKHIVGKGETVSKIAEQYKVKPAVIYEINPDAKKGIKFKEVLLVPVGVVADKKSVVDVPKVNLPQKEHLVVSKETLYGIAKQYGVKVVDLNNLNPNLEKKGLRVGSTINVPVVNASGLVTESTPKKEILKVEEKPKIIELVTEKKEVVSTLTVDSNGNQLKEVLAKETLYGIAKEFNLSVSDLEKANPILETQSLKIGQKLIIPVSGQVVKNEVVVKDKLDNKPIVAVVTSINEAKVDVNDSQVEVTHEVLAKETKYGIAKEFGLTVKELEAQNPKIINKLLVGEKLTIRTLKSKVKKTDADAKNYFNDALNTDTKYDVKSFHGTDFIDQLISTASENIGVRYRTGGTSKDGFDCSGLMCTTFGAYDIQLPRTSFEQSQYGVKVNNEEAQKGDLIFFKTNGRNQINHVGMVVEVCDGEIKFIHASVGGGVIISSNKEKYYSKRVSQINRVL